MERKRRLVGAVARIVIERADELTALDAAIGDGDHGANMKRGFEAVLQDVDALSVMSLPELLKAVGMKLVAKVGGASGPLYGTLFLALSKGLPERHLDPRPSLRWTAQSLRLRRVGRANRSENDARCAGSRVQSLCRQRRCSICPGGGVPGSGTTIPMRATRGRASFLGERSVGHMDPGARSASLMIGAVCDALGGG